MKSATLPLILLAVAAHGAERAHIVDVLPSQDASHSIVRVVGDRPLSFTTMRLAAPPRVVVDVADADVEPREVAVGDGTVNRIASAAAGARTARVVIELAADAEFDVRASGDEIDVRVPRAGVLVAEAEKRASLPTVSLVGPKRADPAAEKKRQLAEQQAAKAQAAKEAKAKKLAAAKAAEEERQRVLAEKRAAKKARQLAAAQEAARKAEEVTRKLEAKRAAEKLAREKREQEKQERLAESKRSAASKAEAERLAAAKAEADRVAAAQADADRIAAEKAEQDRLAAAKAEAERIAAEEARLAREAQARDDADRANRDAQAQRLAAQQPPVDLDDDAARARFDREQEREELERQRAIVAEAQRRESRAAGHVPPKPGKKLAMVEAPRKHKSITSIGFRPTGAGEVVIRSDAPLEYGVTGEEGAVLLHLPKAAIPLPNNRRPLDTRFFDGPVQRVVPVETAAGTDLRIELKERAEFHLEQTGPLLTVTFTRP